MQLSPTAVPRRRAPRWVRLTALLSAVAGAAWPRRAGPLPLSLFPLLALESPIFFSTPNQHMSWAAQRTLQFVYKSHSISYQGSQFDPKNYRLMHHTCIKIVTKSQMEILFRLNFVYFFPIRSSSMDHTIYILYTLECKLLVEAFYFAKWHTLSATLGCESRGHA